MSTTVEITKYQQQLSPWAAWIKYYSIALSIHLPDFSFCIKGAFIYWSFDYLVSMEKAAALVVVKDRGYDSVRCSRARRPFTDVHDGRILKTVNTVVESP